MAVPCKCGAVANIYSSVMLSAQTKKCWVQCPKCMRLTTRLDEEAEVLFEGIEVGSDNALPDPFKRLRLRNAGVLKRAKYLAEKQLELPV